MVQFVIIWKITHIRFPFCLNQERRGTGSLQHRFPRLEKPSKRNYSVVGSIRDWRPDATTALPRRPPISWPSNFGKRTAAFKSLLVVFASYRLVGSRTLGSKEPSRFFFWTGLPSWQPRFANAAADHALAMSADRLKIANCRLTSRQCPAFVTIDQTQLPANTIPFSSAMPLFVDEFATRIARTNTIDLRLCYTRSQHNSRLISIITSD